MTTKRIDQTNGGYIEIDYFSHTDKLFIGINYPNERQDEVMVASISREEFHEFLREYASELGWSVIKGHEPGEHE